jgi:hypothetical protein
MPMLMVIHEYIPWRRLMHREGVSCRLRFGRIDEWHLGFDKAFRITGR